MREEENEKGRITLDSLSIKNNEGQTPLMLAVIADDVKISKCLIELGVDIEAKDKHGYTPLMMATSQEMRNLLLAQGQND